MCGFGFGLGLNFSRKVLRDLTSDEKEAIKRFYEEHEFDPNLIDTEEGLHERIRDHPMIQRSLEVLKRRF